MCIPPTDISNIQHTQGYAVTHPQWLLVGSQCLMVLCLLPHSLTAALHSGHGETGSVEESTQGSASAHCVWWKEEGGGGGVQCNHMLCEGCTMSRTSTQQIFLQNLSAYAQQLLCLRWSLHVVGSEQGWWSEAVAMLKKFFCLVSRDTNVECTRYCNIKEMHIPSCV